MNTGFSLAFLSPAASCKYLFILLLCSAYTGLAQNTKQNNPLGALYKAKKVKTVTALLPSSGTEEPQKAFYREYNLDGALVFEMVYDDSGSVTKKYQGFYNVEKQLVKEIWKQDFTDSVLYKYKGSRLTEETWYWGADKSKTRVAHFYDSLGLKVCTVSKNAWGVYVDSFFYDKALLIETRNYDEHGLLNSITKNNFDTQKRLINQQILNEQGIAMQTLKVSYTEGGPLKSETTLFAAPSKAAVPVITASMAENYKYDTQKQLREVITQSYTNNELLVNNKVTYTYGDKGLPVSQSTLNQLNNSKAVLRFVYTYH